MHSLVVCAFLIKDLDKVQVSTVGILERGPTRFEPTTAADQQLSWATRYLISKI